MTHLVAKLSGFPLNENNQKLCNKVEHADDDNYNVDANNWNVQSHLLSTNH